VEVKNALVIRPSDPGRPAEFQQIAAPLRAALGDRALRIDHIGSTAVPGLAAKDVLDVQVTVAALDSAAILAALAPLGHVLGSHDDSYAGIGPAGAPALWLYASPGAKGPGTHIAFRAASHQAVDAFYRAGLKAGASDYIPKPVEMEKLFSLLRVWLYSATAADPVIGLSDRSEQRAGGSP